jgi:hypothetical protein
MACSIQIFNIVQTAYWPAFYCRPPSLRRIGHFFWHIGTKHKQMNKDSSSGPGKKVKLYILFPVIYVLILLAGLLVKSVF